VSLAFLLLNVDIGAEEEVLRRLSEIEFVKEAYIVYGVYDVIAKVVAPNMDVLREIVTSKIRKLPRVRSTLTMIVVGEVKS